MKINSVQTAKDSIFFPLKNIQAVGNDCLNPDGASWLGNKIIITPDWNYFLNIDADTIRIKTSARLNEKWIVFKSGNMLITGAVTSIGTMTFCGLTDSVKSITLSVSDASGNPMTHRLNNKEIIISKKYGFVHTYNLIYWPDYNRTSPYGDIFELSIAGLTKPEKGIHNITWKEIQDFQPGDEMHSVYQATPALGGIPANFVSSEKVIFKCLERNEYADSIVYKFLKKAETLTYLNATTSTTLITQDTLTKVIKLDSVFDKLPDEPYFSSTQSVNFITQFTGNFSGKSTPNASKTIYRRDNSECCSTVISDGCFPDDMYYTGLGGPYYSCSGLTGEVMSNQLVFYKKGDVIWGTPLTITGLKEIASGFVVEVYPNPANEKLIITSGSSIAIFNRIIIIDLQGKTVLSKAIDKHKEELYIGNLPPGCYFYRIVSDKNGLISGKFIKQ